ncbi:MAG: Gfo/Idh/MocA family oxidoreductase [Acidobacteriota bacterium]
MQTNGPANLSATRRAFVGAMTAASYQRIQGANDRVGVGLVGCGLIGLRHIQDFKKQTDANLVAVSDVYEPRQERGQSDCGPGTKGYRDYRKMLDDKSVEAVVLCTPDHWHALQTIMACAAGKDVYVEKPMTLFVREGRWMTTAARRYKRVVQVGTQGRSGGHVKEAIALARGGHIGKIHSVRIGAFRNIMPGFSKPPETSPPTDLEYDLWLGPAPKRPYHPHRALYNFRWFWDYSGGQMTNLGAHDLDFVHLLLQVKGPTAVSSSGGRFALEDGGETPDTQDAVFEYPGFTVLVSLREASAGRRQGAGTEFFGAKGSMVVSRGGFEVFPDTRIPAERQIPPWSNPPAHPQPADIKPEPRTEARKGRATSDEPMDMHVRNFLDCIKSRQRPVADVEDGHYVSAACHLANISLRLGRKLRWDAEREEIIGDREASAMLVRPYRKPWDDVLRSFNL